MIDRFFEFYGRPKTYKDAQRRPKTSEDKNWQKFAKIGKIGRPKWTLPKNVKKCQKNAKKMPKNVKKRQKLSKDVKEGFFFACCTSIATAVVKIRLLT